jgi:mRNA interferase RelE/StbE
MTWTIEYKPTAIKSIAKLDKKDKETIREFLTKTLPAADNPRFKGEPLHGTLRDYWKYRIGDFRVIAEIKDKVVTIVIAEVGHRKEVYRTR